MSKGLEALEIIKNQMSVDDFPLLEHCRIIEKELKALEIIKENFVPYDIEMLENGKVRIWVGHDKYFDVNKEAYDSLKEGLL